MNLIEPIQLENLLPKTAKSGRTANFVCSVVAGKVTEFLWTKQGQLIKDDVKFRINIEPEASMLLIRNVDLNDAGDYMCIAKNSFSEDRVTAFLAVEGNDQRQEDFFRYLEALTNVFNEIGEHCNFRFHCIE